ncbi:MAG: NUDIX domain-containing protein [Candidatus Symbiothrix sp.]|nr:NUDIX domain-containing protein [Candidatus Symbiothrix sp.]
MDKHPLETFRFCPKCGFKHFIVHDFKSKRCDDCGFVYYFNTAAAVAAFIFDKNGRLLVARRAHEPAKGALDLPGGFVDLRESGEEAIEREIKEETGLQVSRPRYLFSIPNIYNYSDLEVHTLDFFYAFEVNDTTPLHADDDVSELFFLALAEIRAEDFGLWSIRQAVERLKKDKMIT